MSKHPVWPPRTIDRFNRLAVTLGYKSKRTDAPDSRWVLLDYAEEHSSLFRKR